MKSELSARYRSSERSLQSSTEALVLESSGELINNWVQCMTFNIWSDGNFKAKTAICCLCWCPLSASGQAVSVGVIQCRQLRRQVGHRLRVQNTYRRRTWRLFLSIHSTRIVTIRGLPGNTYSNLPHKTPKLQSIYSNFASSYIAYFNGIVIDSIWCFCEELWRTLLLLLFC